MTGPVSSPEFIGREQELAALESLLDRAEASEGAFALVSGESGVGKSRLVAELSVRARSRGMTVLIGECLELAEGELPYAPLIGALRSLRERSEVHREYDGDWWVLTDEGRRAIYLQPTKVETSWINPSSGPFRVTPILVPWCAWRFRRGKRPLPNWYTRLTGRTTG
jgi:hypothetical protein